MKLFSRNKLPTSRDDSDLVRNSALDDAADVDFEGMPPCWQCSRAAGKRIAVKKVLVHDEPRVSGVSVQCECHGETAHITIRNLRWPPPTGIERTALQNIPFFTPHPEHEMDFNDALRGLVKLIKAGEKQMSATAKAADAIRRGAT